MARERRSGSRRSGSRRRRGSSGNIFSDVAGGALSGTTGLAGNLFGDIRDAVVGIPMGVVNLATDPIDSIEQIGKATWHTWSPLFHGDFAKFGKQLYDHPLAPILDVATVFTLGAGGVARGASALGKAGATSPAVSRVAGIRGVKTPLKLEDPTGKRHSVDWSPSPRAGRYALQQLRAGIEGHMPDWYVKPMQRAKYEKVWARDMGGRVVGKSMALSQMLEAGRRLTDEVSAPFERMKLLTGTHLNLIHHGIEVTPEEAIRLGASTRKGHYRYARAVEFVHGGSAPQIQKLRRKELKWHYKRDSNAELAHALPRIEQELTEANARLAQMRQGGVRIAQPAQTRLREPTERQRMEQQAAPLVEQQKIVADLEKRLEKARHAKGEHDDALHRIDQYATQRHALESRSVEQAYAHAAVSDAAFQSAARGLGRSATTTKVEWAAKTNDGNVVIVPRHDAYNLGIEMADASAWVKYAYHKPTQLWKMITIGWAPRAVTNNAVGNWTLYALREGAGPGSARALHDAITWQWGARRAEEIFDESFTRKDVISREFGDIIGNVFSAELREELKGSRKAMQRAGQGFYPIVHTVADKPVRVASLYRFLRGQPEVRAALKEGADIDTAIARALRQKPELRGAARDHVINTAGDYVGLRNAEKHVRQIVPFYLWYRHIARTTGNLVLDTPGRAAVMSRLSALGIESTEELLGEIPEFLKGAVPLSTIGLGGGDSRERKDVLLTQSLNPFASIGEISDLVEAFTTAGGARGVAAATVGINPLITGSIEAVTGRSLLSGAPKEGFGGLPTTLAKATIEGLPQVRLAEALLSEDTTLSGAGNPLLYARDDRSPITSLFGVPLRDMSTEAAARLAKLEAGGEETTMTRRRRRRRSG